jgi:ubiquitin-like 1-activating enzyme E1 B
VRAALRTTSNGHSNAAKLVFEKVIIYLDRRLYGQVLIDIIQVFHSDITNLLSMEDMWRSRAKPTPLSFDGILNGSFTLPQISTQPTNGVSSKSSANQNSADLSIASHGSASESNGSPLKSASGLKDQRALTLHDNLDLFVSRYVRRYFP